MLVYLFAGHALEPLVVDLEDKVPGKEAPVPVRHSPRQDGLHHHPRLLSADDAKAKPGAVIDQVDDLQQGYTLLNTQVPTTSYYIHLEGRTTSVLIFT